jgi:hypothetical protein
MKRSFDAETMRRLLDYEPDTGVFRWRIQPSRNVKAGAVAGCVERNGYIVIGVDGTNFKAHRLAWLHFHGVWPEHDIDHINRVRADNRIANLRDVSRSVNLQNQTRPQKRGTSGYLGVTWYKRDKRWLAQIRVNGRLKNLGYFSSAEAAHAAYLAAKLRLHPGDVRHLAEMPLLPIPTTLFERTA